MKCKQSGAYLVSSSIYYEKSTSKKQQSSPFGSDSPFASTRGFSD